MTLPAELKKLSDTYVENKLVVAKSKGGWERDGLGVWD